MMKWQENGSVCPHCGKSGCMPDTEKDAFVGKIHCTGCGSYWRDPKSDGNFANFSHAPIIEHGDAPGQDNRLNDDDWERERQRIRSFLETGENRVVFGRRSEQQAASQAESGLKPGIASPFKRPNAVTSDFFERLRDTPPEHGFDDYESESDRTGWQLFAYSAVPLVLIAIALPQLSLLLLDEQGGTTIASQQSNTHLQMSSVDRQTGVDSVITSSVAPSQTVSSHVTVSDVSLVTMIRGGERVLSVRGMLRNRGERTPGPVILKVHVLDASGALVQNWDFVPGKDRIDPGSRMRFSTIALDTSGKAASARIVVLDRN